MSKQKRKKPRSFEDHVRKLQWAGHTDLIASKAVLESDLTLDRYTPDGYARLVSVCKALETP